MNSNLPYSKLAIWGFVCSFFAFMLPLLGILSFWAGIAAWVACKKGTRRGKGLAVAACIISALFFAIGVQVAEEMPNDAQLIMSFVMGIMVYLFMLFSIKSKEKARTQEQKKVVPAPKAPTPSVSERQKQEDKMLKEQQERERSIGSYKQKALSAQIKTSQDEAKRMKQESLSDEEVLLAEKRRLEAEIAAKEKEKKEQADHAVWAKTIETAAMKLEPAGDAVMTQEGQRMIYRYADKVLPDQAEIQPDSAEKTLLDRKIRNAEDMLSCVGTVMEHLTERILEASGQEMNHHLKELTHEDLLSGWKAYTFYKEVSVDSEPFSIVIDSLTEELIRRMAHEKHTF